MIKLINKFIIRKTEKEEKLVYHYRLVIYEKTRQVLMYRNDLLIYTRQFFDDKSFKNFKEQEERSIIQLCIKHPEVISYSKLVRIDK